MKKEKHWLDEKYPEFIKIIDVVRKKFNLPKLDREVFDIFKAVGKVLGDSPHKGLLVL